MLGVFNVLSVSNKSNVFNKLNVHKSSIFNKPSIFDNRSSYKMFLVKVLLVSVLLLSGCDAATKKPKKRSKNKTTTTTGKPDIIYLPENVDLSQNYPHIYPNNMLPPNFQHNHPPYHGPHHEYRPHHNYPPHPNYPPHHTYPPHPKYPSPHSYPPTHNSSYHNHPPYNNFPSYHNHSHYHPNGQSHFHPHGLPPFPPHKHATPYPHPLPPPYFPRNPGDNSPGSYNPDFYYPRDPNDFMPDLEVRVNANRIPESKIPVQIAEQWNSYENVSDLLLNFVELDENEDVFLANRFTGDVERNSAVIPKQAVCMPEIQTVKIINSTDSSIMYFPSCTRIERCGGCCSHPLIACRPTDVETVSFQVFKTQYTGGSKLKNMGKEIVLVEKHLKCKCGCKVQQEDCKEYQEYRKAECRCACKNTDEQKKCQKNNATKLWNPDTCICQCRESINCSTGFAFDPNSCRCSPIPVRRRDARYDGETQRRTGYRAEELPAVIPLYDDSSDD